MTELQAMLLSAVIEAHFAALVMLASRWPSRGLWHVALASTVATAVSHPFLWQAVLWGYDHWPDWLAILLPEAVVALAEGALIGWMAQMRLTHAMLVSFFANGASLLAGLLLQG